MYSHKKCVSQTIQLDTDKKKNQETRCVLLCAHLNSVLVEMHYNGTLKYKNALLKRIPASVTACYVQH